MSSSSRSQPKPESAERSPAGDILEGRVLAAHGRHYVVRTEAGTFPCFTRGKKSEVACGDRVAIERIADDQGVIAAILPRTNLLYRSDAYRSKLLAANLSLVVVVVATEPAFSEDLLGRTLVCAEVSELPARIVLNKVDMPAAATAGARSRLSLYSGLGYPISEISAKAFPDAAVRDLMPTLLGKTTLFLGQSGMGKSTLLNLLVPDAQARTREISQALQTGKHTTSDSRLYDLPDLPGTGEVAANAMRGSIIDTPGFQEFGLAHLTHGQIERAFPEFRPRLGSCRFYNCTHLAEPGCAIRQAADDGAIAPQRYRLFGDLIRESRQQ